MKTIVLAAILVCSTAGAFAQTPNVAVYGFGSWGRMFGSEELTGGLAEEITIESDDFFGYGLGVNAFWGRSLSTELTVSRIDADAHLRSGVISANLGTFEITPITLTVQFHTDSGGPRDLYLGVGAAWLQFNELQSGDLENAGFPRLELEEEVGWLVNGGIRFGWTRRIGARVDLKYVAAETSISAEGEDPLNFDVSPIILSAGIDFRF